MRVIGGILKGKKLYRPLDQATRPLKDIVKESIFNVIQHSSANFVNLKDSLILDLFSGTGSFGIECLSRGAKKVLFCENYQKSLDILKKNIEYLNLQNKSEIIKRNIYEIENNFMNDKRFDLIFIDPPFKDKNLNILIDKIEKLKILKPNSVIIIHRNKKIKEEIINKFKIFDEKIFGLSKILFGKII